MTHRHLRLAAIIGLALATAACRSKMDKADAFEAQSDRLLAVKAYPAAMSSIQQAIGYDDTTARRYLKLAELQMISGQPSAASASFQAALDLQPDSIEALQNLSILAARSGRYDDAHRYIDPLLALSPDDPAGLLASGVIALNQRRYREASVLGDRIITALPDRTDGYVLKARALDSLGHTRDAIALLQKRAAAVDNAAELLQQVLVFYRKIGDVQGVRDTAIRLMPLLPDDPRYALESARAYQAQGKPMQARRIVDDLARRGAGNADVIVAIAQFWRDTVPPEQARAEIVRTAAGVPIRTRMALADELTDLGDTPAALRLLAPAAAAAVGSDNVDVQASYARTLFAAGQFAAAQAKSDAVLAFDQNNAVALLVRARLKLRRKDYRGAVTDAQLVSSDDDQNEDAAMLVPEIYAAQGNQTLAAGAFGSARQRFPDSAAVSQAEIEWLLGQGRTDEAVQRAATFFHTHTRSTPAVATYRSVCRRTRSVACRLDPAAPWAAGAA